MREKSFFWLEPCGNKKVLLCSKFHSYKFENKKEGNELFYETRLFANSLI